jgi:maltose O-acetyltransferase
LLEPVKVSKIEIKWNNLASFAMPCPYLIKNRLKESPFSYKWLKVWAKRAWTFPSLLSLSFRRGYYARGGVQFGNLADMNGAILQGAWSQLSIGSGSFVGRAEIQLLAPVTIGNNVIVNDGVRIITGTHSLESPFFDSINKSIIIHDSAWICTGAILLPGVTIGKASVVAAGAVVTRDVPPGQVVAGNPARFVKMRGCDSLAFSPNLLRACYEAWLGNVSTKGRS